MTLGVYNYGDYGYDGYDDTPYNNCVNITCDTRLFPGIIQVSSTPKQIVFDVFLQEQKSPKQPLGCMVEEADAEVSITSDVHDDVQTSYVPMQKEGSVCGPRSIHTYYLQACDRCCGFAETASVLWPGNDSNSTRCITGVDRGGILTAEYVDEWYCIELAFGFDDDETELLDILLRATEKPYFVHVLLKTHAFDYAYIDSVIVPPEIQGYAQVSVPDNTVMESDMRIRLISLSYFELYLVCINLGTHSYYEYDPYYV